LYNTYKKRVFYSINKNICENLHTATSQNNIGNSYVTTFSAILQKKIATNILGDDID